MLVETGQHPATIKAQLESLRALEHVSEPVELTRHNSTLLFDKGQNADVIRQVLWLTRPR